MLSPRVRQIHSPSSHAVHTQQLTHLPSSPMLPPSPVPTPDPSAVDFRTFYPYTPNEVKHRKRTSRAQLKVLEDHFRRDTKPNAGLRKVLADQLGMSVRGVQVWFQNRRAKEKALATKALSARKPKPSPTPASSSPPTDGEQQQHASPGMLDLITESPSDSSQSNRSTSNPPEFADNTSSESSPVATNPPQYDSCPTPWQNSPSHEDTVFIVRPGDIEPFDSHVVNLRRGSLPVYAPSSDFPLNDDFTAFGRRRSVDNSLHRLASHPYAHLARAKNGALFGGSYSPPIHTSSSHTDPSFHHHLGRALAYSPHSIRPRLSHTLAVPHDLSHIHAHHRASLDHSMYDFANTTSSSPLTPFHALRATLPGNHMHFMSSRTIASPLPGPLPSPDFSFGIAPSPPPQISSPGRDSPDPIADLNAFAFQRRRDDPDTEDDATSGSYDAYSRFGSMVSLAGSESSNTSAYYSDVGSCVADDGYHTSDVRRGSSPNGRFLNMMSGLDVNAQSGLAEADDSSTVHGHGSYPPREDIVSSTTPVSSEMLRRDSGSSSSDGQGTTTYPSPSSTVSHGLVDQTRPSSCFSISRSSELAFALHGNGSQDPSRAVNGEGTRMASPDGSGASLDSAAAGAGATHTLPFFFVPGDSGPMYAPPESSIEGGSSLSLPLMDYAADKFSFDGDIPHISPYHTTATSSSSSAAASALPDGQYKQQQQQRREAALHGMDFAYSNNHNPTTVDPSSLENGHCLHSDSYNAYT